MKNYLGLLLISCVLIGCATANRYVQPKTESVAKLVGSSQRSGVFDWEWVGLQSIDDKYVPVPFMGSAASVKAALTPEPHRMVAHSAFNRQFGGGGPYEAYVRLEFTPVANGSYRLVSNVRDNVIEVWVEDVETKGVVSDVFSAPFRSQPKSPTYVPIFIPAGG